MAYATKTDIENYLNTTISSSMDTQITSWIAAVQAWIDTYTGRTFEAAGASTRLYDGSGTDEILTDDFIVMTKIEILDADGDVDETIDYIDEYFLYPENETAKNRIVINAENSPIGIFPEGNQNIKVYATFGFAATVPADIKLAATMLVAGIIEKSLKGGNVESERLGDYSISFGNLAELPNYLEVTEILDQYRDLAV